MGCFYVTAILSWGYGWRWVEAEVDLNLRLKWGWDEIEWKFSWSWVEVKLSLIWGLGWNEMEMRLSRTLVEIELSWGWDKLTLNKGRNWAFIGVGLWFKIFLFLILDLLRFCMVWSGKSLNTWILRWFWTSPNLLGF